jgi:mitochondrial chaperone BCS1
VSQEIAAPAPARGAASDLITTLRERAPRLALAFAAGQAAWPAAQYVRSRARERATYTVKVPGDDGIYDDLHEWVLGLLSPGERRALVAWSSRRGALSEADSGSGRRQPPSLRLRYDGTREQVIRVAGHQIKVAVSDNGPEDDDRRWKPPEIMFTARSATARDALVAEIAGVLRRTQESARKPSFRMLDKWGSWERLDDLPPRGLDSVVLPAGQIERLTADVERFLASEQDYLRRCVPWHRGHLYEGPPGTGKTSVARAIASHFGMDVWYLPLADVKKDGDLLRLVTRVTPRSMLLLEDVDVFHAATERDDDADVTLSGLLNALDGIATPHGLLTVLTTNTPEVLDDAVSRAGRVDLVEHFSLADASQVAALVASWYGRPAVNSDGVAGMSPAEVIEACKRHDRPAAALAELAACPAMALAAR